MKSACLPDISAWVSKVSASIILKGFLATEAPERALRIVSHRVASRLELELMTESKETGQSIGKSTFPVTSLPAAQNGMRRYCTSIASLSLNTPC